MPPISQSLSQVAGRRVNRMLAPQLAQQASYGKHQNAVIRSFANSLLGKLQPIAGQVGADYDAAIKQIGGLSGQAAGFLAGQNPAAAQQKLLGSVGAPASQQAQQAQALGDTFQGGAGVLAYTGGTIPGSQMAANKAAAMSQARQLPAIGALKGQQDVASALWQQGQNRQELEAQRPELVQKEEAQIQKTNLARAAAQATLSLVTVGWSKAGADGGGLVVLAAGCAVLGVRLATGRLTAKAVALAAGAAVALGLALVGLDAATGGSSHVTRRVDDGPGALLRELVNRLHISVERLASSWHAALVFAVSVVALVVLATRRPRFAAGDALLVAVAVSLLVNDTPQHVAAAGAISYAVLWTFERLDSPSMRRAPVIAAVIALAAGLAACGYEGQTTASPETVEGSVPTETTPTETTDTTETETTDTETTETQTTETTTTETTPALEGDPVAGKTIFVTNCGGCHTLSDAGTSGTIGPNLDDAQPDEALVVDRVTNGQGAMPPFAGTLSEQQIADVAAYVSTAAGS